jgi:hypothetical protein
MTPRLAALVKRVAELCEAGLKVCHCVEEFTPLAVGRSWLSNARG